MLEVQVILLKERRSITFIFERMTNQGKSAINPAGKDLWSCISLTGILGRWQGPENGTLLFYECRLSGGDTQRWREYLNPTYCNQICLNFFALVPFINLLNIENNQRYGLVLKTVFICTCMFWHTEMSYEDNYYSQNGSGLLIPCRKSFFTSLRKHKAVHVSQ